MSDKMFDNELEVVHFDAAMSRDLGMWLTWYPDLTLSKETFFNILIAEQVICNPDSLGSPPPIKSGPWGREFNEMESTGKLIIPGLEYGRDVFETYNEFFSYLALKPQTFADDFVSFYYCFRNRVPFRTSQRGRFWLPDILDFLSKFSKIPSHPVEDKERNLGKLVEWIFDIEVPELEIRSRRIRSVRMEEELGGIFEILNTTGATTISKEEFITANKDFYEGFYECDRIYISPPEFLELLGKKAEREALREVIRVAQKSIRHVRI